MAQPIEDYALIGDRRTAALVGKDGSVDWLCLPRFDSPACFAALLGDDHHGRWLLAPADDYTVERSYVGGTALLETTFTTATGRFTLTDLMPTNDGRADLVRRVRGVSGTVRIRHEWVVRFDYGKVRPWVSRLRNEEGGDGGGGGDEGERAIVAVAGPDKLVLRGPRLPVAADGRHADEFDVHEGDELTFAMTWVPSWSPVPAAADLDGSIRRTRAEEEVWSQG